MDFERGRGLSYDRYLDLALEELTRRLDAHTRVVYLSRVRRCADRGVAEDQQVLGYRGEKDKHWSYWIDANKKLAYIRVAKLERKTARELEEIMSTLRKENLK